MEYALGGVPEWAERVVEGPIRHVAPCGHYLFPDSYLQAVEAIGSGAAPRLVHTCFTVERRRKERMSDYALCFDAWLVGAKPSAVASELAAREPEGVRWHAVCTGLWHVLGERTELKELLVERVLHQTRWWLKATVWDDDLGTVFYRDHYLGDCHEDASLAAANGNPRLRAPGFDQSASPRVQNIEARLAEICPHWKWFRTVIVEFSWPCAPKAFRYMEKLLWSIGKERPAVSLPSFPLDDSDEVPGFLQCQDTWPNQDEAARWWTSFLAALAAWWQGRPAEGEAADAVYRKLGDRGEVKRWLVRLLVHRLEMAESHGGKLGLFVNPPAASKRGAGRMGKRADQT